MSDPQDNETLGKYKNSDFDNFWQPFSGLIHKGYWFYLNTVEKPLKFEAEGREFAKFLRSLEQFIQTVKGQNNFW